MHSGRTIAILVALIIFVVYGSPAVPAQSERSSTSPETVVISGLGPVPFEEFREIQLRQASILATLGTIIAPFIATVVGTLLTNIANGITAAITATLTSGFGLVKNSTKLPLPDHAVPGPYHFQLPTLPPHADIHPENYVLPPYVLNHPLTYSAGHLQPFIQFQSQDHDVENVNPVNGGGVVAGHGTT